MPLSVNDILSCGWKRYHGSASADAIITAPARIMAVILTPAAAAATLLLDNKATAGGTDRISLQAAANGNSAILILGPNGTRFDVGVSTTLGGAGVLLDIFYTEA